LVVERQFEVVEVEHHQYQCLVGLEELVVELQHLVVVVEVDELHPW